MSTFTQFNGPQGASGPSAKDITALIDAYNNLSVKLTTHIAANTPTDAAVHGIVAYVNDVKTQLEAIIGAKAAITTLNDVKAVADAAATKESLSAAITNMQQLIANKADTSALAVKADTVITTNISDELSDLTDVVNNLKAEYDKLSGHITDTTTKLAFDCAIESATFLVGKLRAFSIVDFTKWAHFSAPFAGTGGMPDTATKGAFIIGCLSLNWSGDNTPEEKFSHKAARVYIKYVNTKPFDAICDMAVSRTDEGYVGSLSVHLAKKSGTWKDLAFHLLHGTNSNHKECVYLAISADGLSSVGGDYSNTNFRACGENFLPVGEDGYVTPTGMLECITSAIIGTNASNIVGIDNLRLNQLWSPNYFDGDGFNLLRVVSKIDPDDDSTYRQVFIGDAKHDEITFIKRPSMIIENDQGEQLQAYFVTAQDIINVSLPVGAIIRWAPMDDDGTLKNIPYGYLACDGSLVSNVDYPELCELLGFDEFGMSALPNESHSIIKAKFFSVIDKAAQPDYDELVEFSMLSKKINKEISRAQEAESGLSERIDLNKDNLEAEITRATEADETNAAAIAAETERATAAEELLQENIDAEVTRATEAEEANTAAIEAEVTRATEAEEANTAAIEAEVTRATEAEETNKAAIEAEVARATAAEELLQDNIDAEVERATAAEEQLQENILAETARATAAEDVNADAIADETSRAIEAETTLNERVDMYEVMEDRLQGNIDAEALRAQEAEKQLQANIDAEETRATEAEAQLQTNITAEETRATEAEAQLQTNITAEETRATGVEEQLQDNIDAETVRATAAEEANAQAIEAEVTRATDAEEANAAAIEAETQRATQAEEAEAATRAAKDTELTQAVAEEKQRASQAELDLSNRIDELHPND